MASKIMSAYMRIVELPYLLKTVKPCVEQIIKEFTFTSLSTRSSALEVIELCYIHKILVD